MTAWNTPAWNPTAGPPDESMATSGPRWHGNTLDLTGADPATDPAARVGESGEDLETSLTALVDAIDEVLANPEVRLRPAILARLVQARARVRAAYSAAALSVSRRAQGATPAPSVLVADDERAEAGHFLG